MVIQYSKMNIVLRINCMCIAVSIGKIFTDKDAKLRMLYENNKRGGFLTFASVKIFRAFLF